MIKAIYISIALIIIIIGMFFISWDKNKLKQQKWKKKNKPTTTCLYYMVITYINFIPNDQIVSQSCVYWGIIFSFFIS